jgi:hypothetical protein
MFIVAAVAGVLFYVIVRLDSRHYDDWKAEQRLYRSAYFHGVSQRRGQRRTRRG